MAANRGVRLLLTSAPLALEISRGASQSVPGLYTLLRPENGAVMWAGWIIASDTG